jgi:dTDP-4-amino-4,6-dideoxygalactose transaminase
LAQMRQYPSLLAERKRIFNRYDKAFNQLSWAIVPPSIHNGKDTSCHLYALRIKDITELQRDSIIDVIAKKGVSVNVHFIPMPMLTFFKDQGYDIANYPQAYENYACEISLPIYPQLTEEEILFVIDTVKEGYETVIQS